MRPIDIKGQRFGRWLVLARAENHRNGQAQWSCLCDCGAARVLKSIVLRTGHSTSCGCLKNEILVARSTKHGHSSSTHITPTYFTWAGMVARCNTKSHASYERYGGRGIRVCERWLSYENFLADMGIKPKGMTLDRKDNNLGYCKENCRWATEVTQARNRSNTIYIVLDGVSRPLRVWAELLGINPSTLASRIQHGMPPSEALRPGKMKRGPKPQ